MCHEPDMLFELLDGESLPADAGLTARGAGVRRGPRPTAPLGTTAGAAALADSPHLGGLIHLNLYGNPISDATAARLRERFGDRVFL